MVITEKGGYGSRDDKGYWRPPGGTPISPFFRKPFKPREALGFLLKWGGYLRPWNFLYVGLAFLTWFVILPEAVLAEPLR